MLKHRLFFVLWGIMVLGLAGLWVHSLVGVTRVGHTETRSSFDGTALLVEWASGEVSVRKQEITNTDPEMTVRLASRDGFLVRHYPSKGERLREGATPWGRFAVIDEERPVDRTTGVAVPIWFLLLVVSVSTVPPALVWRRSWLRSYRAEQRVSEST